ncbi:MAG TPA: hypothetical protein VM282_02905 [Acidimicrobiales bacterium]|nr:hypothetical protein [Acidimicrobiales bacterium]
MDVRRSIPSDVRLSAREARALRRIEDAAVAEDPLLDVRLGLPLSRFERSVVGLRRRSKAIGRAIANRCLPAVVAVNCLGLVLALLATGSFTMAAVLSLPIAFALGVAISRPPRLLTTSANVGLRRIREHPGVE